MAESLVRAAREQPPSEAPRSSPRRPRHRHRPDRPAGQHTQTPDQSAQPQVPSEARRGGRGSHQLPRPRPHGGPGVGNPHGGSASASGEESGSANVSNWERGGSSRRGRGRGGRQGLDSTRLVNGRRFGGDLTTDDSGLSENSQLQADAPAFVPGQLGPNPRARQPPRPKQRRLSKSQAPDIATRTHEDIDNGHYECAVCTNEIYRNSKIWSCGLCWSVLHLSCVKKWSQSESARVVQRQQAGDMPAPAQWRCPGCNLPQERFPSNFTCWCEKEVDPKSIPGLPPFSCGQTCSRNHVIPKKCPHACGSICHAGPCPPCPLMGPTQSCFCGRDTSTKRCVDTNYDSGFSCGQICGEVMPCGQHFCDKPCHEGLCGACEVVIDARCYCGQESKQILCCDQDDEAASRRADRSDDGQLASEEWTGIFECYNLCDRPFDCGVHQCQKACHPQDFDIPHCPRSPDVVTHCPCGKRKLEDLADQPRQSCQDPIPSCKEQCGKLLACSHECSRLCHTGDCEPCNARQPISCRCGRVTVDSFCHQGQVESPECMRACKATLNCGRHECGERCCPGERKAAERQARKRKARPLDSNPQRAEAEIEAEHICTRPCGRPLKCGNHVCEELCHKGPCNSCREAIFEEVSCACGRTVLQPPLPCGTRPPPCRFPCERSKDCGHPQTPHNCHQDDEPCPKCPFLTTKSCLCGKHQLKNQPCWLVDVRCGEPCGQKLKCGFHRCRKPCHRPGECEDAGTSCKQECGKEKSCGHPCSESCHSPFPCKEDKPCPHKIFITCDCQRIKEEVKCQATKHSEGSKNKSLKCDDECARLERNRKLALALNIDAEAHKDDHIPYAAETLNMYLKHLKWATEQEKALRVFAADPDTKRLRLKPMPSQQRAFIHALSEDFGFDTESMDPEPHRHVAIFKTPRFVMAPMKTLAECARIRRVQNTTTTMAQPPAADVKKQKPSNVVGDPYNGFLLTNPRFALTTEELRSAISPALAAIHPPLELDISFLPSEEVVLRPKAGWRPLPQRELEAHLSSLKPSLSAAISAQSLGTLQLCRLDESLNLLRHEGDTHSAGWSQVAAKGAAPRRQLAPPLGQAGKKSQNSFTVLSTAAAKKRADEERRREREQRRQLEREVEDDWEVAELRAEERERGESAAVSGDEGGAGVAGASAGLAGDDGGAGSGVEAATDAAAEDAAAEAPSAGSDGEVAETARPEAAAAEPAFVAGADHA